MIRFIRDLPSCEHIPSKGSWEDEFPFPLVGYVSSLEIWCVTWCNMRHLHSLPVDEVDGRTSLFDPERPDYGSLECDDKNI